MKKKIINKMKISYGVKKGREIVLGITGSIAAYKACDLISRLRKEGHNVTCIVTAEAEEFITKLTLETLSGNRVYTDMFRLPEKRETIHVSLARRADLIVICPATANVIGKLASGISDDLLTCTAVSTTTPLLIVPAMNDNMFNNKITQRNIRELKGAGYRFVDPVRGHLACGYVGVGHLAGIDEILKAINNILKK